MSAVTTTSQKSLHRNRFSRNTAEADIRELIRELEKKDRTASNTAFDFGGVYALKRLLKYWGLEKP